MEPRQYPHSDADEFFPIRLFEERLRQGLSQEELSDLTRNRRGVRTVTRETISNYERGKRQGHAGPQLRAIASVLRVTPAYLLRGDERGMSRSRSAAHARDDSSSHHEGGT